MSNPDIKEFNDNYLLNIDNKRRRRELLNLLFQSRRSAQRAADLIESVFTLY